MVTILTIAGSDPTGGAGVQADLRTFERLGAHGVSAVTAITAQTKEKFTALFPTPADILTQQLSAVLNEKLDAIKIGMIVTTANVEAITLFLRGCGNVPVVIDPVFDSSTGFPLIEKEALPFFEHHLLPLATVVTPNIVEAITLSKMNVSDIETMKLAAKIIYENMLKMRCDNRRDSAVVVTGGHLEKISTDILYDGLKFAEMPGEKLGGSLHGSGCRYSSAFAFYLAKGADFISAAKKAKEFVVSEIQCV